MGRDRQCKNGKKIISVFKNDLYDLQVLKWKR
jgi:hypothetical protein